MILKHPIARRPFLSGAGAFSVAAAWPGALFSAGATDTVYLNGLVHTVDPRLPRAQSVVVRGGRIAHVGSNASARRFAGRGARMIDLKGALLLPGFIDGHNHAYLQAEEMFFVQLKEPSLEGYRDAIRSFLAARPDARQLRGVGVNLPFISEQAAALGKEPRELLDEMVGQDIPAVIIARSRHEIWTNTAAIRMAGVTRDTPTPPGSAIDRNAQGAPVGIFREMQARNMIIQKMPAPDFTVDEFRQTLLHFQTEMAAPRGVTSAMMPIGYRSPNVLDALASLSAEDALRFRYEFLPWADESRGLEQVPYLAGLRAKYDGKGPFFSVRSIKFFGTGINYREPGFVWDQAVLEQTVAALDRLGFRIYIHDIGPIVTYDRMLDALEYARARNGRRDARHVITHVAPSADPTAARFKALDVIADGHPAPRAFFDAGVRVTSSADFPVTDFNPMGRISRGMASGVSAERLIESYTANGAYMMFREREIGSISVGKRADLVALDTNILAATAEQVALAKPLLTLFNGETVWRSSAL